MQADGSDQHPLFSDDVQAQLNLQYNGVNERVLSWVEWYSFTPKHHHLRAVTRLGPIPIK